MKLVVTGASGNVGTALLRQLQAEGEHDVLGVARRRPPAVAPYDYADWEEIDLGERGAEQRLTATFADADAVIHLAWLIQPSRDPEQMRRVNQGGTRAVITAARTAGVGQLVHMSSVGTYAAAPKQWKDETWSTAGVPTSHYSMDKAAGEAMLDAVADLPVARVRPALILQPDAAAEIERYFLGRLVPWGLLRPSVLRLVPFPAALAIQFVHAEDVARALVAIVERRATGAFNLAASPVIDRSAYAAALGGVGPSVPIKVARVAAQSTWRARLQPTDGGWVDLAASVPLLRTERARRKLDWAPRYRADETLRAFVRAMASGRGGRGPLLRPRGPGADS